ncbi:Voltage-gated chloride channel family protein [Alkalibacterium sp. AK22]|uniref:ClC family H(+)/Cl(-) exchange transporter n=1 Tax=Alkalibacterium sp. AK22 TaxID=1229520 RepID=UPI000450D377|nr:ClC family H(+)/Cl(-) exchange transporter [Alkalibacterium sp. AK22]EXJ23099.1 Voltage-gated chloride channel family protein [Alkalibacterium sp. AK22]
MKKLNLFEWSKISYVAKGILVGILVGIIVSLFRVSIEILSTTMADVYAFLRTEPIWLIGWVFVILLMAFIIAIMVRDEPDIRGSGIQDIEGQLHGVLKLDWFSILWRKFIGGVLSIGSGLALGREGPSIQLGGAVGQGVNHFMKGNKSQQNILISAGASAGLSAAFNAPVSGIMFILEEVHHKFSGVLLLTAFSASITANFIAYQIFGVQPALDLGSMAIFPLEHYAHLVFLGIFLALGGWAYQETLMYMPVLYKKLPIPPYLNGFVPFIMLIPVGLFLPSLMGGGTTIITNISSNGYTTGILIGIFVFRFIYSHISYGSGLPGGIFIPVLSLGALLGAIYGNGALWVTGIDDILLRSFIIYAMGGLLTAVTKAPLTAVMLITEMTGNVTQLMPLAVVCLTSYVVADFLGSDPVYEELLQQKVHQIPKVFEGEVTEFELSVEPDSDLDGMMARYLHLPYGSRLIKVKRHQNEFIPHQDTVFWAGDELFFTADSGFVAEVKKYLNKIN